MGVSNSTHRIEMFGFVGRVIITHVITYVGAGVLFSVVLGEYTNAYSSPAVSAYIRPTTDPLLAYSPLLQLVRGAVIAIALLPLRTVLIDRRWGWTVLFGVLVALQQFAAPGGVIEALIYTKLPISFQLLNVPEVVLQLFVFSVVIWFWERRLSSRRSSRVTPISRR